MVDARRPSGRSGEDRRRRLALDVGVLAPTSPPGRAAGRRVGHHADRIEAIVAGPQRQLRVVVARLGVDRLLRLERDVRRVARPPRRRCRPGRRRRSAMSPWRRSTPVPARLRSAQPCAASPSSTACTVACGHLVGHRQRDGAGAGAQVDHDRRRRAAPARRSIAQPAITSVSGRGTKTPGPDREVEVAEAGDAGEVLQWLARGPSGDQRVDSRSALGRRRRRRRSDSVAALERRARAPAAPRRRARGWRPRPARSRSRPRQRRTLRAVAAHGLDGRQPRRPGRPRRTLDDRLRAHRRAPGRGCAPCSRRGGR